jgi:hypothetical protein
MVCQTDLDLNGLFDKQTQIHPPGELNEGLGEEPKAAMAVEGKNNKSFEPTWYPYEQNHLTQKPSKPFIPSSAVDLSSLYQRSYQGGDGRQSKLPALWIDSKLASINHVSIACLLSNHQVLRF